MNRQTKLYRQIFAISLLHLLFGLSMSAVGQLDEKLFDFDIPSQSLGHALLKFSEQSGANVIGSTKLLEDIQSKPLYGKHTLLSALQQLLMGSGLVFEKTSKDTFVIVKPQTQMTDQESSDPQPVEPVIEEVKITGIRMSLTSALNIKRTTDAITDVISEEEMGKFPDANVVESLQRVTGVSISRGRAGEGQFITVRGLGQQYNLVTVNGRTLATDNIGREFSFDVLPSELISGAQVYKTPLASLPEGSIGAHVDMTTAKPLDRPGNHGSISIGGLYDDLAEKWGPKISGTYSDTFADDRFGVSLAASYSKREWRSDMVQSLGIGFSDFDLNQDGDSRDVGELGLQHPNYLAYPLKTGTRERLGMTGAAQFKLSDLVVTTLDFLYTEYKTPEDGTYQTNNFVPGNNLAYRPGSIEVDENGTITHFIVDNYATELATDPKNRNVETWQVGWNTKWQASSALLLDLDVAFSRADRPEGGKTKFWVAGIPGASAEYWAGDPIPSLRVTLADGRDISEATNDEIYVNFMESQGDDIQDELSLVNLKGELDTTLGALSSIEFGMSYSERSKDRVSTRNDPCLYCNFPFSFGDVGMIGTQPFRWDNFLEGENGVFPSAWPQLDAEAIYQIVQAAEGSTIDPDTGLPYPYGYSEALRPTVDLLRSSWIDEEMISAFTQFNFSGDRWYGNIGARFSRTGVTSAGYSREVLSIDPIAGSPNREVRLGEPFALSEESSYFNFLPSSNLTLEITDDFILRASAARTMARPSIAQLGFDINYETNLGISRKSYNGNPALNPVEADQVDLSFEWYISDDSLFSTAFFYKEVSGFISDETFYENVVGEQFLTTRPANSDDAEIAGVELAMQYLFDNGFGFQINSTYAESDAEGSAAAPSVDTSLVNFSKYSYNIIGLYEKGHLSTRVAFNYRDRYIVNGVGQGGRPETADGYAQLDFRSSYNINQNFSVYLEGLNVTGEAVHIYSEYKNRLIEYEKIGRRFSIGLRYTM